MAELFQSRYTQDVRPRVIEDNLRKLNDLSKDYLNVEELKRKSQEPVGDLLIETAQARSMKRLTSMLRNDQTIQGQLRTLAALIDGYTGNSRDELAALFSTLRSRITTARENVEIENQVKKRDLALQISQRREKKSEQEKKLEAQRVGKRLAMQMQFE